MPITALPGYDGRAFESSTLIGSTLRMNRGNGTFQEIILPAAGSGTAPAAVQVGVSPHYMNFNQGGLFLNYAGIKSLSFWIQINGPLYGYVADSRVPNSSAGYFYSGGTGGGMVAYCNGNNIIDYSAINSGSGWKLVYIEMACGPGGINLLANQSNAQFNDNVDMADLRVYSRVWTAGEKANTVAANVPTDALLARYDFTSVTSTQVNDQSGNATSRPALFIGTHGLAI